MGNPFVHVELATTDVAKAKKFYSGLFDWKMNDLPMGPDSYTMLEVGEGTGGGIMKNPMPGAPSMWMAYVGVENLDAVTKKAEQLGAKIMKGRTKVGDFGWFSMIVDPTGAMLALWESKKK